MRHHGCLEQSEPISDSHPASILVCLSNGRFVVIRDDKPRGFWPVDGGWQRLWQLQPGDEVIHHGDRATVRAVLAYR